MRYIFILIISLSLFANSELGDIEFSKKNYVKAIEYYKLTNKKDDKYIDIKLAQAYVRLADNYVKIRNYDYAIRLYKDAIKLNSTLAKLKLPKVYDKKGDMFFKIKDYKQALIMYKKSSNKKKIKQIEKIFKHKKQLKNDLRKVVTKDSPSWTKAIGRLIIPTKLQFITKQKYKRKYKKCSASLINLTNYKNSNVIITASHCVNNYNKNAGMIKFIIQDSNDEMIYRVATVVANSKFKIKKLKTTSDWAILTLNKPISTKKVKPFILQKDSFIKLQKKYKYTIGSLGGFSKDIANYGAKLTYDPKCKLKKYTKMYGASTCTGFNGSSGGPIVLTTSNNNIEFQYHFVGVVSHFKHKNFHNIYFTPHNLFYKKLKKIIKENQ